MSEWGRPLIKTVGSAKLTDGYIGTWRDGKFYQAEPKSPPNGFVVGVALAALIFMKALPVLAIILVLGWLVMR